PDYRETIKETSQLLTQELNLPVLVASLNATVAKSMHCETVALYLRGNENGLFVFPARVGEDESGTPQSMPKHIAETLCTLRNQILRVDAGDDRRSFGADVAHELEGLNWHVVLPIVFEKNVIGAVIVGPKLSGDPFYPHDLDLLMTLANHAGIAIKNAQLYAQVVLANEYIENIVATIESGVIGINPSNQITIFNRAAEQLTGLKRDDVRMQPVDVLPDCLSEVLKATVADGDPRVRPEVSLAAGDVVKPVICTTSPLRDPAGATVGAVAVFSDLTPFKELEAERGRAERLRYLEVLAAGIAHEIKNPLVAIKTFAQLIPRRHSDDRFVDDFSRVVTREIGRMEQLVDRLRTLSRPAERPRLLVDLRRPLADAIEFLQPVFADKRVGLALHVADNPYVVLGEPAELEQLFLNLIMNAYEATPPGGQVSVEVAAGAGQIGVLVADTGPGIPAEFLERVFEPFFSTKQRGSGLGLAISSRIAAAHGAKLRAQNHAQGGAVFTVEFAVPKAAEVPIGA
ncbi:MAG: PAS domain-containing protein, partial [Candidatus Rokubacteria bacterium]|nr:PAS domain-containing protein [Candidatus Rokubacteria bacterium]